MEINGKVDSLASRPGAFRSLGWMPAGKYDAIVFLQELGGFDAFSHVSSG